MSLTTSNPTNVPSAEATSFHMRLMDILKDKEAMARLLSLPKDALTRQQEEALGKIAQHYGVVKVKEQRPKDHRSKRQQSEEKAVLNPLKSFLALDSLSLPLVFHRHLQDHGADPRIFFTDKGSSLRRTIMDSGDESDAVGDVFMSRYNYTIELEDRSTTDNWRWCFIMLMYFDLVKLIRPDASGKKVGHSMHEDMEMMDFLKPLVETGAIKPEVACRQFTEWCLQGSKLDLICTHFGEGSLFFLGPSAVREFRVKRFLWDMEIP